LSRTRYLGVATALGVLSASLCGCVLGPTALQVSRVRYNEVIRETRTEQLLLNLVRLQYREEPLFLDVVNVAAQFRFGESANLTGTINEGPTRVNPDSLELGAGVSYLEQPTMTFAPLQGKDFVSRLLSPLPADVITLLSKSGWSIDRILRLTVQAMNDLDNAPNASGPTPEHPPRYEEFARVCRLFRNLQESGLLEMGYESHRDEISAPLPAEGITLADVVEAARQGYRLQPDREGKNLVLTEESQTRVWRLPPAARGTAEVQEIVQLLGLKPGQDHYEIEVSLVGQADPSVAPGERTVITIAPRSLMGTLFYLSQAIEVPQPHRQKGYVTTTRDAEGLTFDWTRVTGDLLRVHSQRKPPRHAAVAVRHWGYWYYVDNSDLTSKSSLALLGQLFALQAGGAEAVAPVLTLPVGG